MVIENSHIFDEVLSLCKESDCIVIPIPLNHRSHPSKYNLSGIYILLLDNMQKYYIPINHSEALKCFTLKQIMSVINSLNSIYVVDSKEFMHIFGNINCYDSNAL